MTQRFSFYTRTKSGNINDNTNENDLLIIQVICIAQILIIKNYSTLLLESLSQYNYHTVIKYCMIRDNVKTFIRMERHK